MRFSIIRTVFLKELKEMLRDRRSLAVMFGLPLVLYPLIAIGFASLGQTKKKEMSESVAKVVLTDPSSVPHLEQMLEEKESGIELVPPQAGTDPRQMLLEGKIDAAIEVGKNLETQSLAGQKVDLKVMLDRSRTSADYIEKKLRKLIEQYQRWVIEQRLRERNVPESVLTPVEMSTDDVASTSQRFGHILAGVLPVLLMMTGMLGALFPALNATTTERELGTLEALLLTPATRFELLSAKGLLVLICALLTAGLNMLSMSMVTLRAVTMVREGAQHLSISVGMLALSYLAAVPALIFFSAIVLIVGLVARNFREANSFATPVMLIPLAAMAVSMMEPKATPALLITPVANTTIVIREVLTGRATAGQFLLAFASSCLYAGIILSLTGRLFSSEQLVNPSWEPVSLKLFRRGTARKSARVPAVDEALVLLSVVLLLLFYVGPEFMQHGLLPAVLGNELLLILAPTLIFAWLGGWDWKQTFNLRGSGSKVLIGAALLGMGLSAWAPLIQEWQNKLWPADQQGAQQQFEDVVKIGLQSHAVLNVIVLGLLAGVCEEMLFRGPIQNSLLRRVPAWFAIIAAALLFSAIHLDAHGFPIRALLGGLLGWIAWRSGSIFPAMLTHALFDTTQLALYAWKLHHGMIEKGLTRLDKVALAVGAALVIAAWFLLQHALSSRQGMKRRMSSGFTVPEAGRIPSDPRPVESSRQM